VYIKHVDIINNVAWNIRNYRYVGDVSVGGGQATCIQTESKLQAIPISQASRTPRRRRWSLQELPAAGDRPAGKKAYPAPARAAVCPPRRPRCSTDATPASKILAAVAIGPYSQGLCGLTAWARLAATQHPWTRGGSQCDTHLGNTLKAV
jgi:hypothetical protein